MHHRLATEAGNVYHGRALGWCGNTGEIYPGNDGGGLLLADGKQAEYHGDGGYRSGSVCGFAGGASGLLYVVRKNSTLLGILGGSAA